VRDAGAGARPGDRGRAAPPLPSHLRKRDLAGNGVGFAMGNG
jgi:hypothetical protein